jgi:hypothetical protein
MDANELRALQAPLKKQYREQPATALTPARAEAMLDMDRIVCRVRSWAARPTLACIRPPASYGAFRTRRWIWLAPFFTGLSMSPKTQV